MLRYLRIGNVRDNRFLPRDGINKEVCQVQIPGAKLVNNPMHGVLSNNPQDGMHKCLLNNNPQGGAHKIRLRNNKLLVGVKCLLNNKPPHGMRKTRLSNNKPQGGAHKTSLRNSLLLGTRLVQQVLGDNNNGMRLLLHPMHGRSLNRELRNGANRVTNLLHQQRMGTVAVRVKRGHNKHK
jgi:hypothetical protein